MKFLSWYPLPQRDPERFFWVHLVILHFLLLAVWEIGGREAFESAIATNPDALDREFYGMIAKGMRFAVDSSLVLWTGLGGLLFVVRGRRQPLPVGLYAAVILALSAVLQLLAAVLFPAPLFADSVMYAEHAFRLLATGSYVSAEGAATAFWPVGYPVILAAGEWLTGDMVLSARLLNIVCNLLTAFLAWRLLHTELSEAGGLLLLAVMALLPSVLFSAVPLMTESPALTLLMLALYFLIRGEERWHAGVVAGLCFAAASHLRPVTILITAAILLVLFIRAGNRRYLAIVAATFLLALAPWTIRNTIHFNTVVPISTNGGFNFLLGNHADASGGINSYFIYDYADTDEAAASKDSYARGWADIAAHPLRSFLRIPKKIIHAYKRGDASLIWTLKPGGGTNISPWLLALLFVTANLAYYLVLALSLLAVLLNRWRLSDRRAQSVLGALMVSVLFSVMVYFGSERYVIPLLPLHVFLCARFFFPPVQPDTGSDTAAVRS